MGVTADRSESAAVVSKQITGTTACSIEPLLVRQTGDAAIVKRVRSRSASELDGRVSSRHATECVRPALLTSSR